MRDRGTIKGKCSKCHQRKDIVFGFVLAPRGRSFCSECLGEPCYCDIRNKQTTYRLYSNHLRRNHNFDEVVSKLTYYKIKYGLAFHIHDWRT